eukprot:3936216-Amphidinium_carterae.1
MEEDLYQVKPRPTVLMVSRLKAALAQRSYELKTSALLRHAVTTVQELGLGECPSNLPRNVVFACASTRVSVHLPADCVDWRGGFNIGRIAAEQHFSMAPHDMAL